MTTSRVIRGTRAKISLYICAILIITGLIACYNSTLSQLYETRKSNENCHQHEDHLSTQLQVISEYKQRLENSLKNEKAEHQQSKINFENKLNEERGKCDKIQRDSKLKHSSLQQHFNLLQTEYDDFKEECSKNQHKVQEDLNDLQSKLKETQEQLKKITASNENLKSQYLEIQIANENLENKLKQDEGNNKNQESDLNHVTKERNELKMELERLKLSCKPVNLSPEPPLAGQILQKPSEKNAQINNDQQQRVLDIPNEVNNKLSSSTSTARSELKASQANLGNNVQPLLIPTVTPESVVKKKLPEGVVAVPEDKSKKKRDDEVHEVVNNRYRNVNQEPPNEHLEKSVKDDMEKENGAHEEFDNPMAQNGFDGLNFAENMPKRQEKSHIDNLGIPVDGNNNKKNYQDQEDVQLEENEEDDDDGYDDHLGRQKDQAVRN